MYTKITQSGGRRYLQLVEGFRDDAGKVRHRVAMNPVKIHGRPAKQQRRRVQPHVERAEVERAHMRLFHLPGPDGAAQLPRAHPHVVQPDDPRRQAKRQEQDDGNQRQTARSR